MWKQNNIYSGFEEIISGVPQGSIVGPILFNAFLNDLFYDIGNASVHNFADDSTLSCFAKTVKDLINVLKEVSKVAINWFSSNDMIANPDNFKSIILFKSKSDDIPNGFSIGTDIVLHREICKTFRDTLRQPFKFQFSYQYYL